MKRQIGKFWPFDYDQEVEIYESPSWDMPGLRKPPTPRRGSRGGRANPYAFTGLAVTFIAFSSHRARGLPGKTAPPWRW